MGVVWDSSWELWRRPDIRVERARIRLDFASRQDYHRCCNLASTIARSRGKRGALMMVQRIAGFDPVIRWVSCYDKMTAALEEEEISLPKVRYHVEDPDGRHSVHDGWIDREEIHDLNCLRYSFSDGLDRLRHGADFVRNLYESSSRPGVYNEITRYDARRK